MGYRGGVYGWGIGVGSGFGVDAWSCLLCTHLGGGLRGARAASRVGPGIRNLGSYRGRGGVALLSIVLFVDAGGGAAGSSLS